MPRLLRRKFTCFYCNRRSAQDRKAGVQQWKCEQCDAVNHLDENGEITDPPVPATSSADNQSHSSSRSLVYEVDSSQRPLFCQRCIQNQHIVSQTLAEYLPSQDDPEYFEYERSLPQYRKSMEDRYPQVCAGCAPAVEARIRSTGYAAKADHLRRTMDRTRGNSMARASWSWKLFAAILGAIGWSIGLLGDLTWHILEALPVSNAEDGLISLDDPQSIRTCLDYAITRSRFTLLCSNLWKPLPSFALGISISCLWWHPRMQYKLKGGYGRVIGCTEYYKLQLVSTVIRFMVLQMSRTDSILTTEAQTVRAFHAFVLVIEVMSPLVSFQENNQPLIPIDTRSETNTALRQDLGNAKIPRGLPTAPFPIEKLAPRVQQPSYQPPTPPPEEEAEIMSMDWTPQHNFRPASVYHAPRTQPVFNGPSPFHGVLPPAPVSWAQRLRNPPNQPAFHKASATKKQSFFGKGSKQVISDAASDVSSEISMVDHGLESEVGSPVKLAPPRFFAPADRMETGLESLFGDSFALDKDIPLSSGKAEHHNAERAALVRASKPSTRIMATIILAFACIAWDYSSMLPPASTRQIRLTSLLIAGLIPAFNMLSIPALSEPQRSISSMIICFIEAIPAVALGYIVWNAHEDSVLPRITGLGLWYLLAMMVQEVWHLVSNTAVDPDLTVNVPSDTARSMPQKREVVVSSQQPEEPRGQWINSASSRTTASAKASSVQLSQRTTRSMARQESRRDSLGVDGLGSLSLGKWIFRSVDFNSSSLNFILALRPCISIIDQRVSGAWTCVSKSETKLAISLQPTLVRHAWMRKERARDSD
ncbi:MAG: hypothetical protein Q9222_005499 [Ikaeria aurantiellina]